MFKLEKSIKKWRKLLEKHQDLEPGFVEELESHLRDKIESLLNQGYSEEEAYHKAVSSISETGEIAEEYAIARTRGKVRPPWKNRFWIPTLLPNFLKTAFRNFWRQKSIASLNIMGLALGIICCIFISLYIWDELRFDAFHSNADRIFRVVETTDTESESSKSAYVTNALGPAAEKTIPEVSRATRVFPGWRLTVGPVESALIVRNYHIVDGEFLTIFDFPLKYGSTTGALDKPGSVVLSSEMARTLFGEENPVGESIRIEAEDFPEFGDQGFTVTGVLKTLPENSHLGFRLLLSKNTIERFPGWNNYFESWTGEFGATYLLLDNHNTEQQVEAALQQLLAVNLSGENAAKKKLELQPLKEIHFYSADIQGEFNQHEGQLNYIYLFGFVTILILIIACINYMNIATARSVYRAKEIGMRKAAGASRKQIIIQFMGESGLSVLLAVITAYIIIWMTLPYFNALTGKAIDNDLLTSGIFLAGLLILLIVVTLIAGFYPAVYLSGFQPTNILKGSISTDNSRLRKGLVVFQFTLSIVMIASAMIAQKQMQYIQSKNLGFEKNHRIVVDINYDDLQSKFLTVREELSRHPAVDHVTVSSRIPGDTKSFRQAEVYKEGSPPEDAKTVFFNGVDEYFLDTYEIELKRGRNFDRGIASDTAALLINETAARTLFPDDPLNNTLHFPNYEFTGVVVGITEDFNFQSLHHSMEPMILGFMPPRGRHPVHGIDYFTIAVSSENISAAIDHLKSVHNEFDPVNPVEYTFLDERIQSLYEQDRKVSRLFGISSALAVLIAAFGLFGLSAFYAERRTKEIGIRKVLGARITNILVLMTSDFVKLIILAFIIAIPISWYVIGKWLQNFAYQINIGAGVFLIAGSTAIVIALITISWQSLKASMVNPVECLKNE